MRRRPVIRSRPSAAKQETILQRLYPNTNRGSDRSNIRLIIQSKKTVIYALSDFSGLLPIFALQIILFGNFGAREQTKEERPFRIRGITALRTEMSKDFRPGPELELRTAKKAERPLKNLTAKEMILNAKIRKSSAAY